MPVNTSSVMSAPVRLIIVLAIMIAFYGADKFLAAQEQVELREEARSHYEKGQQLLHGGNSRQAVVDFARAYSLERSNREYQLALATAEVSDNQNAAATETLGQLLTQDPNDGRANLLMARLLAGSGRYREADSYYHRAIYGSWPTDMQTMPRAVRMELAGMLGSHGSGQELLSELLLLQNASAHDPANEKQIADLFLKAGSVQRASEAYRHILQENPEDLDARLNLAKAELRAGNYRAAENAVMAALRLQPYNEGIQSQLRMVVRLASLDPTSRRLGTREKYRRSVEILHRVQAELTACGQTLPEEPAPAQPGTPSNEMSEAILDRAENLWKQRNDACRRPSAPDDPLPLLMQKLAE